jgi:hypothetical protein
MGIDLRRARFEQVICHIILEDNLEVRVRKMRGVNDGG